jgi:predicted metal-dependent hydrolase
VRIGELTFEFIRKPIKNLHISVLPPSGALRVAAPEAMTDTAVRMAVVKRIPWIKKQQAAFLRQARESSREVVTGETHYWWGKRLRLERIERHGKHQLDLGHHRLRLYVSPNTSKANCQKVIDEAYRRSLKEKLPDLLAYWTQRLGVKVQDVRIQRMRTKWGSCAIENQRVMLNLELAKKPVACLEYVLVHELVHLLERKHSERFVALLNEHLPDWAERKALLAVYPLGY